MTALQEYQRLESTGLWRESNQEEPVEVVISFGTATLVLSTLDEAPLTHWSLSALSKTKTTGAAVIYTPDAQGEETLLISDPDMIAALEKVQAAHGKRSRKSGRLRGLFTIATIAALAAWAYLALPGWLERHVATNIPREQAILIGQELLADIKSRNGLECSESQGTIAVNLLAANLPGTGDMKLHVLELGPLPTLALPGNRLLINKQAITAAQNPEEIAGWIAGELARARNLPPLLNITKQVTPLDNLLFLFRGGYSPETSVMLVEKLLNDQPVIPEPMDQNTLDILKTAGISSSPFAQALQRTGAEAARIKVFEATADGSKTVLDDQNWVALQGICN